MAALTGLSPGWAALVAGGGLGVGLVLGLLNLGLAVALPFAAVSALLVGALTLYGGRQAWARSPQFRVLPYRARRAVMESVIHGRHEVDPTLAPAVGEQAARVLRSRQASRRALVLLSIGCALQLMGVVVGVVEGDSPRVGQVWPVVLLTASLPVVWHREPRRMALARTAEDAAKRAGA